ncbi:nucleotidyltransferase domain-containing protein [Kribbella soli]|uniref:Nucleotidyltransferase domain-containing protein n=1 Tax=Kribbella soli TaxID=1124743 RepID=A0A4R0HKF6_9ACTN|nr:nucleotidyltransferase domain-containing protein [Kribbella soli]TCC10334.1 nucleotidyltransferase domain-containing protein [Kribbella soli]
MTVTEVWLYGSVARGTFTPQSDLDLLVASDAQCPIEIELEPIVAGLPQVEHRSITSYTWPQLAQMSAYGSLFLLHLKLEARLLHRRGDDAAGLVNLLGTLQPYRLAHRDLRGFSATLDDVAESLADGGDPAYELSVIATVIRHCSVLACYLDGEPEFSRDKSIPIALERFGMHKFAQGALEIYKYRIARARKVRIEDHPSGEEALMWLDAAKHFVDAVGSYHARK